MSQTIQRCPKCGFPFVYCQCKTPIREAAEALIEEVRPGNTISADSFEEIIQRVLRERVPEKTAGEIGYTAVIEAAKGYNQCRKEIGL